MNGFTLREKIISSKKSHENVMILTLCCHGKEALSSEKDLQKCISEPMHFHLSLEGSTK